MIKTGWLTEIKLYHYQLYAGIFDEMTEKKGSRPEKEGEKGKKAIKKESNNDDNDKNRGSDTEL